MGRITLTPKIISAASLDAGNRHMRRAGRTKWDISDWNAAAEKSNRLWDAYEGDLGLRRPERGQERSRRSRSLIPKAERHRRWAEVHTSERSGHPIHNARGFAMFGEPARRGR